MAAPTILAFGQLLWNLFAEGPRLGGGPATFACHVALLGCEVALVSAVGKDTRGATAVAQLECIGVRTSLIQHLTDFPTSNVGVVLDAAGKPTFDVPSDMAWDHIGWSPALEAYLPRLDCGDAVYFGTLALRNECSRATILRAVRSAKAQGVLRLLDVNLRPPYCNDALLREAIELSSVLKLSDDEFTPVMNACGIACGGTIEPETALRELLIRYQLEVVVLTLGPEGALIVTATQTVRQPGFKVKVCDTVGAGDAFSASLVLGLLRGDPLAHIARVACEISAAVCTVSGAIPSRTFFKAHMRSMSGR
jgi:fructokinase